MPAPKYEVLFLFDATTGLPKTGLTPTFTTYKNHSGVDLTLPTITEFGGGIYYFTPVTSSNTGIFYVVATGAEPAYICRYIRAEDWNMDNCNSSVSVASANTTTILNHLNGDEELVQSGADAGRLVRRNGTDHTTVLAKWDLLKADGVTKDVTGTQVFHKKKV